MPSILSANTLSSGFDVANSLRFNSGSSDYLNLSLGTPSNRKIFTCSAWVKRASTGTYPIFWFGADANNWFMVKYESDSLRIESKASDSTIIDVRTNALYRDFSAWYHVLVAVDTSQGTASNRIKIYVNGVQETSLQTSTYPNQDTDLNVITTAEIGNQHTTQYFDGYMAEVVFVDGTAQVNTDLGEFDEDSSVWKPIDVSGLTFGTNGFYLEFKQSGTSQNSSGLGADTSGNDNHYAVNNLTAVDQSTDTCTNNYATWNPLWSQSNGNVGDVIFSEGNLKTTTSANYRTYPTTIGFSSGKWYWEIKRYEDVGTNDMHTGVMSELATPANTATWIGNAANGWVFASDAGSTYTGGTESNTGYSSAGDAGDIVQVAFDADNGKIYFGVNGTWQGSADPAAGTNYAYSSLDTSLFYFPCASTGSDVEGNFGSPSYSISSSNTDGNGYGNMEFAVPSGYYVLNSKNLAEYG
jgi:hypothetical protein